MSDDSPLVLERRGTVAIARIDRPGARNSLSRATLQAFGALGRELVGDAELRALVVTGTGDRAFCAGADLRERRGKDEAWVREQLDLYRSELEWLDAFPRPVIAALNGAALGGGLELALLADLRVAAPHAVIGLPETGLGIIPAAGGTQRLPRLIGESRAKELILLGRRLTATEALDLGVINRVAEAGRDLLDDVIEWIEPIVGGAPIAQRAALASVDVAARTSLSDGLELEKLYYEECLRSEDRLEALAAFAEKRKPRFQGR